MSEKILPKFRKKNSEKKQIIIDIAYKQFMHHKDIKIREIAKEAGIHVPTIYKFFDDKNSLMNEVLKIVDTMILDNLLYKVHEYSHPFLKITQLGVNYINIAIEKNDLFGFILNLKTVKKDEKDDNSIVLHSNMKTALESIQKLKTFIIELYTLNLTMYEYDGTINSEEIEILVVIAWAFVHGLANMASNSLYSDFTVLLNMRNSIQEAFSNIPIVKKEFIDNVSDIIMESREIITTIQI